MLWYYIILFISTVLGYAFNWLPKVETLPLILGVDIDAQLVSGMGMFYTYAQAVWPIYIVFQGALILLAYYAIKMVLRFFLGHRAPH